MNEDFDVDISTDDETEEDLSEFSDSEIENSFIKVKCVYLSCVIFYLQIHFNIFFPPFHPNLFCY